MYGEPQTLTEGGCYVCLLQVTMKDREGAEKACADPDPVVDGRKANVNLAYLGAKPKSHSDPGDEYPLFFLPPPPPQFFDVPAGPFSPPPPLLTPVIYPPYLNNQQPLGFLPPPFQPFFPQGTTGRQTDGTFVCSNSSKTTRPPPQTIPAQARPGSGRKDSSL